MHIKIAEARAAFPHSHFSHMKPVWWAMSPGVELSLRPPAHLLPSTSFSHLSESFPASPAQESNKNLAQVGPDEPLICQLVPPNWTSFKSLFSLMFQVFQILFKKYPVTFLLPEEEHEIHVGLLFNFVALQKCYFIHRSVLRKTSQRVRPHLNVWKYSHCRLFISPCEENTFLVLNPSLPYEPGQFGAISPKFLLALEANPF